MNTPTVFKIACNKQVRSSGGKVKAGTKTQVSLMWKELLGGSGGGAILGNGRGWGASDEVMVLQRGATASGQRELSGHADRIPPLQFQSTSKQYPSLREGF